MWCRLDSVIQDVYNTVDNAKKCGYTYDTDRKELLIYEILVNVMHEYA